MEGLQEYSEKGAKKDPNNQIHDILSEKINQRKARIKKSNGKINFGLIKFVNEHCIMMDQEKKKCKQKMEEKKLGIAISKERM